MSRWITLHDHLNPDREVEVDANQIEAITGMGSGSALQLAGGGAIGVHETPTEVRAVIDAG